MLKQQTIFYNNDTSDINKDIIVLPWIGAVHVRLMTRPLPPTQVHF